jgi:hypothetical protein
VWLGLEEIGGGGVSKPLIDIENNCCFVLVVVTVVSIQAARRE